jgi:hypothetical protein
MRRAWIAGGSRLFEPSRSFAGGGRGQLAPQRTAGLPPTAEYAHEYEYGGRFDRFAARTSLSDRCAYNRTYSYSNGRPLMPVFGLPSQLAILPGSVTGCIRERT